ncbi:sigma-70 family RNA polymerase sigma factor [bacterium]|nr:sigma-70 family RNA polymerase sigma factor [bacterium]
MYRKLGVVAGTAEDFAQQVVVWSLEALPSFQEGRPLEGFLLANARNRALNYYRDHVTWRDPPCMACPKGHPAPTASTAARTRSGGRGTRRRRTCRGRPASRS